MQSSLSAMGSLSWNGFAEKRVRQLREEEDEELVEENSLKSCNSNCFLHLIMRGFAEIVGYVVAAHERKKRNGDFASDL
jgi:hypothetical protein